MNRYFGACKPANCPFIAQKKHQSAKRKIIASSQSKIRPIGDLSLNLATLLSANATRKSLCGNDTTDDAMLNLIAEAEQATISIIQPLQSHSKQLSYAADNVNCAMSVNQQLRKKLQ